MLCNRRALVTFVLGVTLSAASAISGELATQAHAQSAPSEEVVRAMLSSVEQGPSAEQWAAMGPETVAVLARIYGDSSSPGFMRLRTVFAARYFPSDASRTFLNHVATSNVGDLFVRQAINSLSAAFGDDALAEVEPFLTHEAYAVREAAVHALGLMTQTRAREALVARMSIERDAVVRDALRAALR